LLEQHSFLTVNKRIIISGLISLRIPKDTRGETQIAAEFLIGKREMIWKVGAPALADEMGFGW
jgi:hypothetical protein